MTKFTFLLPAYKGKYLDEMLRSIQGQTYQEFKVVISDDCSPEDLRSICEPYLQDLRFTYRRNKENMGSKSLVSHWNLLVNMCDTEYLILASDDDIYAPQFLAEIDALTQKYPHVNMFRGRVEMIDAYGNTLEKDFQTEEYESQYEYLYSMFCQRRIMCVANYVFRTEVLKSQHGFVEFPLAWNSDDATVMQMSNNGVTNTSEIVFSFRNSGENISTTYSRETLKKKAIADLDFALYYEDFIKKQFKPTDLKGLRCYNAFVSQKNQTLSNTLYDVAPRLNLEEIKKAYSFLKKTGKLRSKLQKLDYFWYWLRTKNN